MNLKVVVMMESFVIVRKHKVC